MKQLRENGYISMDESGYITLTEKGLEIAERVYERHKVLTDYLVSLGVDEDVAKADACRIEHVISPMSFEMIKKAYKEILENKQAKKNKKNNKEKQSLKF